MIDGNAMREGTGGRKEMGLFTWRGSRGSCGSCRGSRATVILHLKAQIDRPVGHTLRPSHADLHLFSRPGTHRFVGRLLSVIFWTGLTEIRNFGINHAESARKEAKALEPSFGPQTNPALRCVACTGLSAMPSGKL